MRRKFLRLLLIFAILMGVLYTLTGCGNDSKNEGSKNNNSPVTTLYARLYGDGKGNHTLILSSTDYVDNEKKSQDENNFIDLGNVYSISDQPWDKYASHITKVIIKDMIQPTSTEEWFERCKNLAEIENINYLNTSNVTSMRRMFFGCERLTSLDLSNFDTSNVTDMSEMFHMALYDKASGASGAFNKLISLNVSNFDTSNVTNMYRMFYSCYNLTSLDVSNFNTSNVTDMSAMFWGCTRLTSLDLSNFDTHNVTSMRINV